MSSSSLSASKSYSDGRGVETGRDFDTLLEAGGLDRAVAGAEVDRVFAAPVGDDLHFKVVEAADALFDEHAFVLELAECVVADTPVHGAELIDVVHFLNVPCRRRPRKP